jgi:hypothetical protein
MTALILALLAQVPGPMNLNGTNITSVYCDGGVACLKQGSRLTIIGTPSGGGGSGGKVAEAYMADASIFATQLAADPAACPGGQFVTDLAANGALTCATPAGSGGKVAEAYMADAAISAQQAGFAYAADAAYQAQFATTANVAYSADASYQSQIAGVANVAYSADASVFAAVATVATSAYAADASITAQYLTLTCSAGQYVTCSGSGCSCSTPAGGGGGSSNFSAGTAVFEGKSDTLATVTAAWATSSSAILCTAEGEESSVEGLLTLVKSKAAGSFVVRASVPRGTHTGNLPFTCTGL